MRKLAITGIGPLTPIGMGKEDFWRSLSSGLSGIKEISKFSSLPGAHGGEITGVDLDTFIDNRKFRRAADVSKFALAAMKLAGIDAGPNNIDGKDTGLIVAVTHAAMNYTQEYHKALVTGGVEDVSPVLFSDSVLNAPAGNASIYFGIQGAVHTIVGGITASIKAVMLACRLINDGVIKKAFVVSSEEINELSFHCRSVFGVDGISEGSGAVIIEEVNNNSDAYCAVSGFASYYDPEDIHGSLSRSVEKALDMAEMKKEDLDFTLLDVPGNIALPYFDDLPTGTVSKYTGNAFCVSSVWNIILSALIIDNGVLPDSFNDLSNKRDGFRDAVSDLLVCNIDETGAASAIVLSKD